MMNNNLKVIKTKKFKNVSLYLRFSLNYKHEYKAAFLILSKLIGEVSTKYPSKVEMTRIKDMLYGISCNAECKGRANIITLNVDYTFINPKFLKDITMYDYVSYIKESLFNVIIKKKDIDEIKRNIISNIKRSCDKPSTYAYEQVVSIISSGNKNFSIYANSKELINDIKSISIDKIKQIYDYVINKAQLNVFIVGDLTSKDINILSDFNFDKRINTKLKLYNNFKKVKDKIENKKISQSYLSVVYKTPFNKKHKDIYAFILGNVFLGVVPTSLLFEEVREKLSLCYSISVSSFKNEGIVRIHTSIDANKKDVVIKEINKQIKRLIDKDYKEEQFKTAKYLLINSLKSISDDNNALVDFYVENILTDWNIDVKDYIKGINKVNKEDISRVFKQYEYYFTYMLKGNKREEDI